MCCTMVNSAASITRSYAIFNLTLQKFYFIMTYLLLRSNSQVHCAAYGRWWAATTLSLPYIPLSLPLSHGVLVGEIAAFNRLQKQKRITPIFRISPTERYPYSYRAVS